MSRTVTTTTETVCRTLWGASAADVLPDDAVRGIYPDPSGPSVVRCPYTGTEIRGWRARRMTGDEPVTLTDDGRGITVSAESWVIDRIGCLKTGREAVRLRESLL